MAKKPSKSFSSSSSSSFSSSSSSCSSSTSCSSSSSSLSWPSSSSSSSISQHSSSSSSSVPTLIINIDADTNRDGVVEDEPQDHEEEFTKDYGAIVLPNCDSDAGNHDVGSDPKRLDGDESDQVDFSDNVIGDPSDAASVTEDARELAEIKLDKIGLNAIPSDIKIEIGFEKPPAGGPNIDNYVSPNHPDISQNPENIVQIYHKKPDGNYVALAGFGSGPTYEFSSTPSVDEPDIRGNGDPLTLYVEGGYWGQDTMITLTALDKDSGSIVAQDKVRMMVAPIVFLSNIREIQTSFMLELQANSSPEVVSRIEDVLGIAKTVAYSSSYESEINGSWFPDQWSRDEVQLGIFSWPNKASGYEVMPAIFQLPRYRGFVNYVLDRMFGTVPDAGHKHGGFFPAYSFLPAENGINSSPNYGGNLLVSPPADTDFPLGRITVGDNMSSALVDILASQRVQSKWNVATGLFELVVLPAKWLFVGHIDEYVSYIPGTDGTKGFKVALASPQSARDLLDTGYAGGPLPDGKLFFYNHPDDTEETGVTTDDGGNNTLIDDTKNFTNIDYKYVRIYDSSNPASVGQVAEIDSAASNGDELVIKKRWTLKDMQQYRDTFGDVAESNPDTVWEINPPSGSKYVLVEDSKMYPCSDLSNLLPIPPGSPPGTEAQPNTVYVPAIITVKEIRDDDKLWKLNLNSSGAWSGTSIQDKLHDPVSSVRKILSDELGLDFNDDFVEIPAFYFADEVANSLADGHGEAWIPGMVNHFAANEHLVTPRPFGPRVLTGAIKDVFEDVVRSLGNLHDPAKGRTVEAEDMVDNWDRYHAKHGEVHCGTNAYRVPLDVEKHWWESWKD